MKKILSIVLSLVFVFSACAVGTVSVTAASLKGTLTDDNYSYDLYSDNTLEITSYYGTEEIIIIPTSFSGYSITSIGEEAFVGCEFLQVVIPSTVTTIKDRAFANCYNLEFVEIASSVESIGASVFEECIALAEITVPENVLSIGENVCDETTKFIAKCGSEAQEYAISELSNYKITDHSGDTDYEVISKTASLLKKVKTCSTCGSQVASVETEGLSSSTSKISISASQTKKFSVKTYPSGKKVTYSTSNKKVATVSSDGTIKGVAAGSAKITAKVTVNGESYKLTCSVTVKKPTYSKLKNFSLYVSQNKTLTVKATPSTYKYKKATWKSSNTKVATVSSKGVVTAKAAGKAKITVTVDGTKVSCSVTVKKPIYSKLKNFSLYVKRSKTLKVKATPSTYKYKALTWKSSNTKVATVSSKGVVTAKAKGKAKITATVDGQKVSCTVTVKAMAMDCKSKTAYKPYQLKVLGGSGKITWSSSNTKIAKVSSSGKVTPLKPGTVTIKAKRNGKVVTSKLTVKWPAEKGITSEKVYKINDDYGDYKIVLKEKSTVTITGKLSSSDYDGYYLDLELRDNDYGTVWSKEIYVKDGTYKKALTLAKGTYYLGYDIDYDWDYYDYDYDYDDYDDYDDWDDDDYSPSATIKVKTTIKPSIVATRKSIGKGYSLKLKTIGVKNGGTWSVSNKSIATINSSGVLKAKSKGTCTVYYKMKDGKKLSVKITVTNPVTCKVTSVDDEWIYNDCIVTITNNTSKKIKYIEVYITQYNYKGSRLTSPYSFYYYDDEIAAFSNGYASWWVNDATKTAKVSIKEVKFTDGTRWRP